MCPEICILNTTQVKSLWDAVSKTFLKIFNKYKNDWKMKVKVQRPNLRIHCHKARFSQRNRSLNYLVTWRSLQGIPGREMWRENTSLGQGYRVGRLYQRRALHVCGRPQLSPQLLPLCQAGLLTDRTRNPASLSFCQPPASSAPPWDPAFELRFHPQPPLPSRCTLSPECVFYDWLFFK